MQICQNSLLTGKNPTEGSTFHYRGVGAQHNYASAFRAKGRFPSPPGAAQRRAPTAPNYCYVNPSAPRSCQGAGQHPGHHIWGAGNILGVGGELRDRAASSLINPCSKKKKPHTRLPGNTSLRAPPPAPNLSFFCFVSAPCEPRLEVLAAAHVAGPPSAPQNRSAGGEAAALGLGPVTATSGLPESAAPPRAAPPVLSSQAQKK